MRRSSLSVLLIFIVVFSVAIQETSAVVPECWDRDGLVVTNFHVLVQIDVLLPRLSAKGRIELRPGLFTNRSGCLLEIHTHDDSGLLHIASAVKKEFTLGDVIEILESKGISLKNSDGSPPSVIADNSRIESLRDYALRDGMVILIFIEIK